MMMQRKDLAKEFSLIVQQEIKNHNDSILATNMALEDFRRQLVDIKEKSGKNLASLNNNLGIQKSDLDKIDKYVRDSLSQFLRKINDSHIESVNSCMAIKKSIEDRESYFLTVEGFHDFQSKVDEWLAHIRLSFSIHKDHLMSEITKVSEKFERSVSVVKDECSQVLLRHEKEREEINRALDVFSINYSGYVREIEVVKHRCFIIEKNIENLYAQIERLKAAQ